MRASPTPMSKLDNVRLWVEALESGEFGQICGSLASAGGYCCLGVAVVVAQRAGVEVPDDWEHFSTWEGLEGVQEFYGIGQAHQPVLETTTGISCSLGNDGWRWDFPAIAAKLRGVYLSGAPS
jgi:hypothetical protein